MKNPVQTPCCSLFGYLAELTAGGSFSFTGTNVVTAGDNRQFYILSNTNSNH